VSGTRVVIADDEAIIRLDLKEILEEAGYDVVAETGRGDEAIKLVGEHLPDLVILDVKMPGMDGISAARSIIEQFGSAVLLLTAFSQRDLIQEAREAGVAAYLVKPFRKAELVPAIEGVLSRAQEDRAIEAEVSGDAAAEAAEDKIETRRLVDLAKSYLMERDGLTEDDAFTTIQQEAMQSRNRMRDVAAGIIGLSKPSN
jgi:response regulator NasT